MHSKFRNTLVLIAILMALITVVILFRLRFVLPNFFG